MTRLQGERCIVFPGVHEAMDAAPLPPVFHRKQNYGGIEVIVEELDLQNTMAIIRGTIEGPPLRRDGFYRYFLEREQDIRRALLSSTAKTRKTPEREGKL